MLAEAAVSNGGATTPTGNVSFFDGGLLVAWALSIRTVTDRQH